IESMRISIDLYHNSMFRARRKNGLDIDIVLFTTEQQPPGHVSQDRCIRTRNRLDDARRLLLPVQIEPPMYARNDEIERTKYRFRIVQRTVDTNIRFDPFEDPKSLRHALIQLVYLPLLKPHTAFAQTARISSRLRMIADT